MWALEIERIGSNISLSAETLERLLDVLLFSPNLTLFQIVPRKAHERKPFSILKCFKNPQSKRHVSSITLRHVSRCGDPVGATIKEE